MAVLAWGWSILGSGRRPRWWTQVNPGPFVLLTLVLWTVLRNLPVWPLTVLAP
jgi:hypothetical protein